MGSNFYLAITLLAKAIYGHEDSPFQAMFSQMLVDQVVTHKGGCKLLNTDYYSDRRKKSKNDRRHQYCSF